MATHGQFDAVVIGAGPAGCMAALGLARRGLSVLLVEKAQRGRWKVCGCCLGAVGQSALKSAGLERVLDHAGPIDRVTLAAQGATTTLPFQGFVGISREALDTQLVSAAEDAGVVVRWETTASMDLDGAVTLGDGSTVRTRVVIDASGLRGHREDDSRVARSARIGLGLTTSDARCRDNELTMAVAQGGYLGRVALPDGRVDFGAAVTPAFVRTHGSTIAALRAIWREAGLDADEVPDGAWRGTPALTRSRRAQDGRILRVGDAAGYVEPFTGEGMSWAMLAGWHVVDDAIACFERGPEASRWPATIQRLLRVRHARCRLVATCVRHPSIVAGALRVMSLAPRLSSIGVAAASGARGVTA
ncbi:MAG: FAD-dependent monooxygenase [Phycisphaerales bacterium]|nr:FAD-dependent monooxygenase [Phycisphaerales bacterium]